MDQNIEEYDLHPPPPPPPLKNIRIILANCPYLIGTVPIFTQEKVGKRSDFTMCPYFAKICL